MKRSITLISTIVSLVVLSTSLMVALSKSPPSLIQTWQKLRAHAISEGIGDYPPSFHNGGYFHPPDWKTDTFHEFNSTKSQRYLIEARDKPWSEEDEKHWSADVATKRAPLYSYSGMWKSFAENCLEHIEKEISSGESSVALDHLIEINSPEFSEWNAYTDPHQIACQLEAQSEISKRTALLINRRKVDPAPSDLEILSGHVENWNPLQHWSQYLLGIRDTHLNPDDWIFKIENEPRNKRIRKVTALFLANLESMKALEHAALIGKTGWTRSKHIQSKQRIIDDLKASKAVSPFTRYPEVWESPAAWLAENDYEIEAYDQWIIDKSLYETFLAARHSMQLNSPSKNSPSLANLREHLSEETLKTLDPLDASLVTWKWNFGEKIAIKYTLPDGKTAYWPEAQPR